MTDKLVRFLQSQFIGIISIGGGSNIKSQENGKCYDEN